MSLCHVRRFFLNRASRDDVPRKVMKHVAGCQNPLGHRCYSCSASWTNLFEKDVCDYMKRLPGQTGWKPHVMCHVIAFKSQPGLKSRGWNMNLAMRTSLVVHKKACKHCTGPTDSPCNRNKFSARWAVRNFSPGYNSPCNRPLIKSGFVKHLTCGFRGRLKRWLKDQGS